MAFGGNISIGGLGSGLDTGAIIEALVAVERIPINLLNSQKEAEQQKLSLVNTFQGLVNTLKDKAGDISTLTGFLSSTVTNAGETQATITASPGAVAGSHTLTVQQVLATDRWAFDGIADPDADLAAGAASLQFDYEGSTYTYNFSDPTQTSLNEIAAAINAGPNGGVTAQVLQTGPTGGATSYQLVLTADGGGQSKRIGNIGSAGLGLTLDPTIGGSSNITLGNNAVAVIDGLLFERESNDFSDVIPGVSIQLLSEDPQEFNFTVSPDKDGIKAKLQELVDAYNEVVGFINSQNTYSEEGGAGGALFGDNILRTVQRTAFGTLFGQSLSQIQNDPNGFGSLPLVGIKMNNDGTLMIDDATMSAKMDEDLDAFADLFVDTDDTGPDTGLAALLVSELDRITEGYTDPGGTFYKGIFENREDSLNAAIRRIDDNIAAKESRLDRYEEQLVARFAALEDVMAQLNAQQAYLGATLLQQNSNG
jgi:flagellar hook-associated protein 2